MLLSLPSSRVPTLPTISSPNRKSVGASVVRCAGIGKNGESNSSSKGQGPFQMQEGSKENLEDTLKISNSEFKEKDSDIWRLFREAQQNILFLNKQRINALEELERVKKEKDSLLDRVEQLEATKLTCTTKDRLSISSELLLRIDSMVLTSTISSNEASKLRRLVMDSRISVVEYFSDIMDKGDTDLLAELRQFSKTSKKTGYHIVHICTEMAPVVSIGPLAQYITGLSCALQRKGNLVEVILPKYACLNLDEVQGLQETGAEFYSYFNGQLHGNRVWTGVVYGIGVILIQPVDHSSFFSHERVYGYNNDFERFAYFSRASLDYIAKSGKQPDVLHIHNWETSIVGPLFWDVFVNQGLGGTRILLTCQSFDSQCVQQPEKLALCGLDPYRLHRPDRLQDNKKGHLVNVLKGGIVYSNKVIVMSSMCSKEQIIRAMDHGLEPTLTLHKDKVFIAPFGFDKSTWDPSVDKFLPQNYSPDNMKGKSVCKVSLQKHLGLEVHVSVILVGCILSDISDIEAENLKTLVWMALRRGLQFVFMGSNSSMAISRLLEYFQEELKDENIRFLNKYDEYLEHLVLAGSDIMLCQSFDDLVLQVPLKAMKYGSAPVAVNFADSKFRQFMDHDFENTEFLRYINTTYANLSLSQAIDELKNHPLQWNKRIMDAMSKDLSWDAECCDLHISAYDSVMNL
nr:probable starch synthase 4, chloroplastic/amyloplastic isoform X2 [Ipomoea batatas]